MTAGYLLDTNLLIGVFDGDPNSSEHEAARNRLRELLTAPDTRLAITPLIRYEVLRGVKRVSPEEMSRKLDGFVELEVTRDDAILAAQVYAQALKEGRKFDKQKFDLFHCVAAYRNQLEVASRDGDIPKIMDVLQQVSLSGTAAT